MKLSDFGIYINDVENFSTLTQGPRHATDSNSY